ncbi:protein of unknown function [Methylorubrum extorquens]|uniref:Uncharacterized protein n=1 Tax=Methylorubrum extorquens TaxID=408 RepID=A0A2N9AYP4_METEX|nr:protein of unknown function [Methylorubrum extorquens]
MHRVMLERLQDADALDWSRAALDSASLPAKKGRCDGPEPDGPGQAGHEAPPRRGRQRHATRPDAHQRQLP